jgi:hypothetical protein
MPKIQPRRKNKTLVGGHGSSASKKNNGNGLNHYKTKRQVKSQEQTQTDPATQPGFPMAKVKSQTAQNQKGNNEWHTQDQNKLIFHFKS